MEHLTKILLYEEISDSIRQRLLYIYKMLNDELIYRKRCDSVIDQKQIDETTAIITKQQAIKLNKKDKLKNLCWVRDLT
jgi:hypothetical protein